MLIISFLCVDVADAGWRPRLCSQIMKAYRNYIGDSGTVAIGELLQDNALRHFKELHLPMNSITAKSVRSLIKTTVANPYEGPPLWVRLECNCIPEDDLWHLLVADYLTDTIRANMRRSRIFHFSKFLKTQVFAL